MQSLSFTCTPVRNKSRILPPNYRLFVSCLHDIEEIELFTRRKISLHVMRKQLYNLLCLSAGSSVMSVEKYPL